MIGQNRTRRVNKTAIGPAFKSIDKTADRLLRSNKECLIPEAELAGHDRMNNCHIIGEAFLKLIANERGEVLCWPASARSIGREAQRSIDQGQFDTNPIAIYVDDYRPVLRSTRHKDCKFTFACWSHDNGVFKPIDSAVHFCSEDSETLFKLGIRTMAAYTAWYRGHKRWSQKEFLKDQHTQELLAKYPILQSACDEISEWGKGEIAAERKLEKEMTRWQSAYSQLAWHRAKTVTRTITPKLRMAATGITSPEGYPVAMTVLPTADKGSLLIATVLEDETRFAWLTQRARRASAEKVATVWTKCLNERSPTEWLPELAQAFEFLYVSPDDYDNDEIITADERREIESAMSEKTPTLRI